MISWLGKHSGLLKIQLLSVAFWLTAAVNSSTWLHAVQITISIYPLWSYLSLYLQAKPFSLYLWWRGEGLITSHSITQNSSTLCSLQHAHNPNFLFTGCSAVNDFEKTLTLSVRQISSIATAKGRRWNLNAKLGLCLCQRFKCSILERTAKSSFWGWWIFSLPPYIFF